MSAPTPCMGGWGCAYRAACPNYASPSRAEPAERLCPKGLDGIVPGLRAQPVLVRARNNRPEVFA